MQAGNAVFVAEVGGQAIGKPLDIQVPQFALHTDEPTHTRARVIIDQAEQAGDLQMIGYLDIGTGGYGVGTLPEFELLGSSPGAR